MTDPNFKKISDMAEKTTVAATDFIPIVDTLEQADANKNKKITASNLRKNITTAEMLDAQVTGGKIAGTTITAANLATDAVETLKIKGANVTYAKIQNVAGLSVLGNAAQAEASVQALAAGTDGHVMRRSGTGIGFGTIKPAGIDGLTTDPDDNRIVFWNDGEGSLGYLDIGTGLAISGTTLNAGDIGEGNIADGAVTNAKLGSDVGKWAAWTPTITYLGGTTDPTTISTTARYCIVGNTVFFHIRYIITNRGNGDRTSVLFTLPIEAATTVVAQPLSAFGNLNENKVHYNYIGYIGDTTNAYCYFLPGAMSNTSETLADIGGFYEAA